MSIEDKVIYGLLRLSLHHNSQVTEVATSFIGNMDDAKNVKKARDAFKEVNSRYNKEYKDLIAFLEESE